MKKYRNDDPNRVRNIDYDKIEAVVKESHFTKTGVSKILGYAQNWLTNVCLKRSTIPYDDLNRLCMILNVPMEELLVEEPKEPEPAPAVEENKTVQQAPAGDFASVVKILSEMAADVKAIRAAFDGMTEQNRKIPVTRRERAVELLRKELISKNGGGVKVEEFKKLLTQAGIGSSYMQDAINELGCRKMLGNNGINYIVKDEM